MPAFVTPYVQIKRFRETSWFSAVCTSVLHTVILSFRHRSSFTGKVVYFRGNRRLVRGKSFVRRMQRGPPVRIGMVKGQKWVLSL